MNALGMHARPSARFVKVSNRYKAEIWVEKDGEQVNGKSIMGLMMLAAGPGLKITGDRRRVRTPRRRSRIWSTSYRRGSTRNKPAARVRCLAVPTRR